MRLTHWLLLTLVLAGQAGDLAARERVLAGRVVLVGPQDELKPAAGVDVTLLEGGDTDRSKAQGLFQLFLPEVFKPGEKITLVVDKPGWRIQYPLDGEVRIPAKPFKDRIEVRLLPVGSRKFWSDDRIEKFIADTAEKAKQEVTPGGRPEDIDFGRYIKEWAARYGFSAAEARAEIDQWVADVQRNQDDLYKLGLAAYAEKNFGKAGRLFTESAENKLKRRETVRQQRAVLEQQETTLTEEIVRDLRLAGDAHYSNYAFAEALAHYPSIKLHLMW